MKLELVGYVNEMETQYLFFLMMGMLTATGFVAYISSSRLDRGRPNKRKENLRSSVIGKLEAEIELSKVDLTRICNAHDVDMKYAKKVLDQIYAEPPSQIDSEILTRLLPLLKELESNQPYDHLPIEVRASLVRLDILIGKSQNQQDQGILSPILAALNDYVDLGNQRKRLNFHKNFAYVISVLSIVIGSATLYFTPSEQQLARSVANELTVIEQLAEPDQPKIGD